MSARKRSQKQPTSRVDAHIPALERFKPLLSPQEFDLLLAELERPLVPSLRINQIKGDAGGGLPAMIERYGWQTRPIPYCSAGMWVTEAQTPISKAIEHLLGYYYIQDAASMLPVELFDINPSDCPLVLDMAASPGGKTTHLVDRTKDLGLVIANDSSTSRLQALKLVLQNWSAANQVVTAYAGERIGGWFPSQFDLVLLDAPCSMQGLRSTENHPMRPITLREQSSLASRQQRLLESALQAVKPGGQVVYSTCTLSPEENEGVLDGLLKQYPEVFSITDLSQRLHAPALTEADGISYDPQVAGAARLWPHRYGTSGFFAALLKKAAEIPVETRQPPRREFFKTGLEPLQKNERSRLFATIQMEYGFDFLPFIEQHHLALYQREERLYALPERWLGEFSSLPYFSIGMLLGDLSVEGFTPSLGWFSRFFSQFTSGFYSLPDDLISAWLRGEDLPLDLSGHFHPGSIIAVCDSNRCLLGKGRVNPGRLKNQLPARLTYAIGGLKK